MSTTVTDNGEDHDVGDKVTFIVIDQTHCGLLAALHRDAFDSPWGSEAFFDLLKHPRTYGWIAVGRDPIGFILCRSVAGEAEILTLAVLKTEQRKGIATRLVSAMTEREQNQGTSLIHLEVAADNRDALALYEKTGFSITGKRKAYYVRPTGAMDALVMSKPVNGL